ncbi:hypothetical protein OESDEN_21509 [Oesophagostomum dentatum]|uniref:Peptidase S9 prolyl oligopeptidase catalytic domain-containing protein n=1 Tax=Oesophagostomum dentatum TaxID=61180 RepID=A0A0B1S1P9_OESDE|nr:hypothetical protein OESDEN_21509 [Oesophagostomum dentatum]
MFHRLLWRIALVFQDFFPEKHFHIIYSLSRQVIKRYPFLDANRLSVYGWSYGGYAAALLPERAPESFFKCAVCVAPVANFLYYDATYTERYMGNADNSAYNSADISKNVEHFKKTRLLLVHGLYDDNVHFQNSAMFMEALQENNIDFDVMVSSIICFIDSHTVN